MDSSEFSGTFERIGSNALFGVVRLRVMVPFHSGSRLSRLVAHSLSYDVYYVCFSDVSYEQWYRNVAQTDGYIDKVLIARTVGREVNL